MVWNSGVGSDGSFIDWFAKGLGQPGVLGAAAGVVVLEEERLPPPFPSGGLGVLSLWEPRVSGTETNNSHIMELSVKANYFPSAPPPKP